MSKVSISIVKGKGSTSHNNRTFVTENVDRDKIKNNIIYKQETLEKAYEKCFGEAINDYNKNQKRSDRKIDGVKAYMEQIRTSGNGEKLFYENVVQIGNMQDCHVDSEQGQVAKSVLDDYMKNFQERNPNLYVFNAVLHLDEQTPHLHIDYIPLAKDYKKGLQTRNSLDRALNQQGVKGKANKYENRTIAWQGAEKDHIEKLMSIRGLERAEEKGLKAKHKSVEHYKAIVSDINNQVAKLPTQIEVEPTLFKKQKLVVSKEDLEQLEQRAKLSVVHEEAAKKLLDEVSVAQKSALKQIEYNKNMSSAEFSQAKEELDKAYQERKEAEELKAKYSKLYDEQKDLNFKHEYVCNKSKNQRKLIDDLESENTALKAEIFALRDSFDKRVSDIAEPLKKQIEDFRKALSDVYEKLGNVVKAIGLLKHDKEGFFRISDLTKAQEILIDGVAEYAIHSAKQDGQIELAEDMAQHVGLSKDMKDLFIQVERNEREEDFELDL